jgi:outer membrane protein assembly factor BamD (BamD/ComL family)
MAATLIALCAFAHPVAGADAVPLVYGHDLPVPAQADEKAEIVRVFPIGSALSLSVRTECDRTSWCEVFVGYAGGRPKTGWARAESLFFSEGIARFAGGDRDGAEDALAGDLARAPDAVVASWLRVYLAYAQMNTNDFSAARKTIDDLIRGSRNTPFNAAADIALAKWSFWQEDTAAGVRAYEQLLTIYPNYMVKTADNECCDRSVTWNNDIASGHRSIRVRINVNRRLAVAKAATAQAVASPSTTPIELATLWYRQGAAVEAKRRDDPNHATDGPQDRSEERESYEAAVAAAPGSDPAGRAAWRLIDLSAPYEWEGDWMGISKWLLDNHRRFLAPYPRHAFAGEARFQIAIATWGAAGYPEVFDYVFPVSGLDYSAHRKLLEQWFDTRGFGGGNTNPVTQDPAAAARAIPLFEDVVDHFPTTASAGLAAYYIGVIYDLCLNDQTHALAAFRRFANAYPANPNVGRARKRIAALEVVASER